MFKMNIGLPCFLMPILRCRLLLQSWRHIVLQGDKLKWEYMGSSVCLSSILFEVVEHKHVDFSAWGHCHGTDNCELDSPVICLGGGRACGPACQEIVLILLRWKEANTTGGSTPWLASWPVERNGTEWQLAFIHCCFLMVYTMWPCDHLLRWLDFLTRKDSTLSCEPEQTIPPLLLLSVQERKEKLKQKGTASVCVFKGL